MVASIGWVKTLLNNWYLMVPFSGVLGLFAGVITYADLIHTKVLALQGLLASSGWAGMFGKINVLLPLTEVLGIMAALLGLKLAAMLVRFIKVLIPNVFTGS